MKTCTRCGKTKPLSEFNRNKHSKDGLRSGCKTCQHKVNRKWREANLENERTRSREWSKTNPGKKREANREWREANPKYQHDWAKANPEKHSAAQAKRRALKAKVTVGDLTAIAAVYDKAQNGNRVCCYLCGKVIPKGERHVDHIVPLSKGGLHTTSNLAVACAACNQRKYAKMPDEVGILI